MKTIILGFDSFDPAVFENMAGQNQLPNLSKFMGVGGYSRLGVCSPPQTEVSWTSIATGADPGGHGVFDFVHRDPTTYAPFVSILPTKKSGLGEQFVPPYVAKTFFEEAAALGYPSTALWWPAMFPARPELPVNTIPGLGTPDIRGQLGVGTLFTTEDEKKSKVTVARLQSAGQNSYSANLNGPQVQGRSGSHPAALPVSLTILDASTARLRIGERELELRVGVWSEIFELKFKAGTFFNIHAITRAILTSTNGAVRCYILPLQIHPLHATWHYSSSKSFAKKLWDKVGPYLTLGWPQDTTGLEDGCISDEQFLGLCDTIFERRKQIFFYLLENFKEGVLASVFDDLDRIQHMFFHNRLDVAQEWYGKLDRFVGEVGERLSRFGGKYTELILSDHGFTTFERKVHLNRWLADQGYLILNEGREAGDLSDVDWDRTRAYAVGLNSIYVNVSGREGKGIVKADALEALLLELQQKLVDWTGPDGASVTHRVRFKHEVYNGAYVRFGPDLVVGYAPGYRASSETGLGRIPQETFEMNNDHWGADHCVDSDVVPAVIFANRDLRNFGEISFRDIPFLAIGKHLDQSYIKPPSQAAGQGQKDLEERLKGLGYL
ncbi:MAG: alkaline phosphatase family protein [Chloroflexota bacterium]